MELNFREPNGLSDEGCLKMTIWLFDDAINGYIIRIAEETFLKGGHVNISIIGGPQFETAFNREQLMDKFAHLKAIKEEGKFQEGQPGYPPPGQTMLGSIFGLKPKPEE
jgi:hypothetical protein